MWNENIDFGLVHDGSRIGLVCAVVCVRTKANIDLYTCMVRMYTGNLVPDSGRKRYTDKRADQSVRGCWCWHVGVAARTVCICVWALWMRTAHLFGTKFAEANSRTNPFRSIP